MRQDVYNNKETTMKKIYITPECEKIELSPHHLIAVSIPGEPNTDNNVDKWANEYDTKEHRSDWNDIWANM